MGNSMKFIFLLCILFFTSLNALPQPVFNQPMYFATATDTEHFPWAVNLINSLNQHNAGKIGQIAVYDLGLTESEIEGLNALPSVVVYPVEKVNPFITTKFVVRPNGRMARGWYSWKPVVLYQALQQFPYVLYIDAGVEIKCPMDGFFVALVKRGYYLFDCGHEIEPMVTKHVVQVFEIANMQDKKFLKNIGISAGIQGLTRSLLDSYVTPIYELAKDIKNFEDDGSAPGGFGDARHDQALFSIMAMKLKLRTHMLYFGLKKYFTLRKHNETDPALIAHAKLHNLW